MPPCAFLPRWTSLTSAWHVIIICPGPGPYCGGQECMRRCKMVQNGARCNSRPELKQDYLGSPKFAAAAWQPTCVLCFYSSCCGCPIQPIATFAAHGPLGLRDKNCRRRRREWRRTMCCRGIPTFCWCLFAHDLLAVGYRSRARGCALS